MSVAQAGRANILVDSVVGVISSSSQRVSSRGASVPRTQTRPDAATSCSGTKGPGKCSALSFGATGSTLLDVGAGPAPAATPVADVRASVSAAVATATATGAGLTGQADLQPGEGMSRTSRNSSVSPHSFSRAATDG